MEPSDAGTPLGTPDAATRPARVVAALCAGMAVIGFAPILVRWAGEAPPMAVVAWRTAVAAAVIAPLALVCARDDLRALTARDWGLASVAGVFLGLHFSAWTISIYHTSVASASVLVTSSPLFIAVLGWVFLRDRLSRKTIVAIGAGVGGATLIALADATAGYFPRAAYGNALALSAAFLVAIYLLIGRALRQRLSLLAYLLPVYVAAGLTTWVATAIDGAALLQPAYIIGLSALLAIGPQLIGHSAFNYAVRYVPAAVIGLATLAEPVVGTLLAVLFFAEVPPPLGLLGGMIVLGAIASSLGPVRTGGR